MGSVSKLCWKHLSLLSIHSKYDMRAPIRHRLESFFFPSSLSPHSPYSWCVSPVRLRLESLSPSLSLASVRLRLKSQSLLSTHPTHEVRSPIQLRLESLFLSLFPLTLLMMCEPPSDSEPELALLCVLDLLWLPRELKNSASSCKTFTCTKLTETRMSLKNKIRMTIMFPVHSWRKLRFNLYLISFFMYMFTLLIFLTL